MFGAKRTHRGWSIREDVPAVDPDKRPPALAPKRHQYDKVGKVLRKPHETAGLWFTPSSDVPTWWTRQDSKPRFYGNHYYVPGKWYPVVPPRAAWLAQGHTSYPYHGLPGQTPVMDDIPRDVRDTASGSTVGEYAKEDRSPRSEQWVRQHSYGNVRWFGNRSFD